MKTKIKKKEIIVICIIILIILVDQITKMVFTQDRTIIEGVLNFTYTENYGGAFGIFGSSTMSIIILNIILLYMIIRFMILQRERMDKKMIISLTLIVSGGVSNLLDRIFRGFVVDFIDINPIFSFPMFNIADIVLVIGWILLIITVAISTVQIRGGKFGTHN